ncbi:uncharacterized protein LOC113388373 [Ctenocephalides felis]|uniref:uncharacterized protein LOC113388373 n=1 Tax=Ctenocephalides felis TaxID=7515 RepID=UPI000E6E3ABD|nr:uncharacterized protein LOC113388373 [Ctenocephalides felis]
MATSSPRRTPTFAERIDNFTLLIMILRQGLNAATRLDLHRLTLNKLEGAAFQYIRRSGDVGWEELKSLLLNRFGEKRSMAELQLELTNLKQHPGENVRTFSGKIERLLGLMYDQGIMLDSAKATVLETAHNELALTVFINGLIPEIRLPVRAARHNDLQEAISMAIQEERNLERTRRQERR